MNDNVEILRRYNRWRRGQALWSATADLPDPRVVGEAIDAACDEIERLRAELAECRRISVARQVHIERLCRRNKFQCAANGCPGCAVCGPVAALAAKGE